MPIACRNAVSNGEDNNVLLTGGSGVDRAPSADGGRRAQHGESRARLFQ
jgi:hypothetical protein